MIKHFVTFSSPGTFFSEERTLEIDSWDAAKAVEMSKGIVERYNATPFAFRFTTRGRSEEELDSKIIAMSNRYYLGGTAMTVEDVKREVPDSKILVSNMELNGWERVIKTPFGNIQPLHDGDVIL